MAGIAALLPLMNEAFSEVRFDEALVQQLREFESSFVNKNPDHIAFFGGNLLGTHPMRFTQREMNAWFDDIFFVDDVDLQHKIHQLKHMPPSMKVGTNVFNLSCLYAMHRFETSKLSPALKEEGKLLVGLILHYKILGSILFRFFPYPTNEAVAMATYKALSRKFELKQYGSWKKLLVAKVKDLISPKSIHSKVFTQFNDDIKTRYALSDTRTRLAKMVKDMNNVFRRIRETDQRITSTNPLMEIDGTLILKDVENHFTDYTRYMKEVIATRTAFKKPELVQVTLDVMHTAPETAFNTCLDYVVGSYQGATKTLIDGLIDDLILYTLNYAKENQALLPNTRDLTLLVTRIRGVLIASKNKDPIILGLRKNAETLVKQATQIKNPNTLSSLRTAVLVYLLLRTFARQYYR